MSELLASNAESISASIFTLRGHRVLLDSTLAVLYGVSIKSLNQAVVRNKARFPEDFLFQLTQAEADSLRSQVVTLEMGRGKHRKYLPYAFTEQGVAMLAGILRSPQAIAVNIEIMRAFMRLRRLVESHAELSRKLQQLEQRYDAQFKGVFAALRELMSSEIRTKGRIGFLDDAQH